MTPGQRLTSNNVGVIILTLILSVLMNQVNAQAPAPIVTKESVIRYLNKDLFISPGTGFRRVQLGHDFRQVVQTWGNPNKKGSTTLSTRKWIYTVDPTTQIAVSGGAQVREIEVRGSFNSPFETTEGVRFGMSPHRVISIYGPPRKADLTRMRYPKKGIELKFKNARVFSITVFKKKN